MRKLRRGEDWMDARLEASGYCFGGDKGGDAPDYGPMAQASKESAEIMANLGREQLAENKRQYDLNYATAKPIVDAQGRLMEQAYGQGNQNYQTFQSEGRPVQQTMLYDALGLNADEIAAYNALRAQEAQATNTGRQAALDKISEFAGKSGLSQAEQTELANLMGGASSPSSWLMTAKQTVGGAPMTGMFLPEDRTPGAVNVSSASIYNDRAKLANDLVATYWQNMPRDLRATQGTGRTPSEADQARIIDWAIQNGYVAGNGSTGLSTDQKTRLTELVGKMGTGVDLSSLGVNDLFREDNSASSNYLAQKSTAAKQRQMDEAAGTALADARTGTNQQMNQLIRQGLRYGWSPSKLAAMTGQAVTANASTQVAAANQARTQADAKRTAKLGDIYNTYAGLGSNAPAFYQAGTQAGNSAVQNQNSTSGLYMGGIAQGNATIGQGQQMRIQGLGNILNSQTSLAAASMNQADPFAQIVGTGLGMWAGGGFKGF